MFDRQEIIHRFAARDCLSRCRYSSAPYTALSDFLDHLRRRGWDEQAISRMQAMVLQSLSDRDTLSRDNSGSPTAESIP